MKLGWLLALGHRVTMSTRDSTASKLDQYIPRATCCTHLPRHCAGNMHGCPEVAPILSLGPQGANLPLRVRQAPAEPVTGFASMQSRKVTFCWELKGMTHASPVIVVLRGTWGSGDRRGQARITDLPATQAPNSSSLP